VVDVLAAGKDIARLKATIPMFAVEWNLPNEADIGKLRTTFKTFGNT